MHLLKNAVFLLLLAFCFPASTCVPRHIESESNDAWDNKQILDYTLASTRPYLHTASPYMIFNSKRKPRGYVCLLAKCGSTLWKRIFLKSLLNLKSAEAFEPNIHSYIRLNSEIIERLTNRLYRRYFRQPSSKIHLPRFMLVRNPYARLLSGYLDKIRFKDAAVFPQAFEKSSDKSFQAFVKALTETNPFKLNLHFQPMHLQCGLESGLRYDEFLKFENMQDWYEEFISKLDLVNTAQYGWNTSTGIMEGNQTCFYHTPSKSCSEMFSNTVRNKDDSLSATSDKEVRGEKHSTHSDDHLSQYYMNKETVELVSKYFKSDFEIFGYPFWNFSAVPLP